MRKTSVTEQHYFTDGGRLMFTTSGDNTEVDFYIGNATRAQAKEVAEAIFHWLDTSKPEDQA